MCGRQAAAQRAGGRVIGINSAIAGGLALAAEQCGGVSLRLGSEERPYLG